jgi:Transposase
VVATDLAESYRAGLAGRLDHATRVADPFHVVRVGNRCLDTVRRRVQNETLGHRGRKHDPLDRIRKLMLTGAERLDERGQQRMLLGLRFGDPHDEVLGAWPAKESVRDLYLTDDPAQAATLLDKTIAGRDADEVDEIRSLGKTLRSWRAKILAHHDTGASNPAKASTCASSASNTPATASAASSTTGGLLRLVTLPQPATAATYEAAGCYRRQVLIQETNEVYRTRLDRTRRTNTCTKPQVKARTDTRRYDRKGPLNPQVLGSSPRGYVTKALVSSLARAFQVLGRGVPNSGDGRLRHRS